MRTPMLMLAALVLVVIAACSSPLAPGANPCSATAWASGTPADSAQTSATSFLLTWSDGFTESFSWSSGSCVETDTRP